LKDFYFEKISPFAVEEESVARAFVAKSNALKDKGFVREVKSETLT
jgi:hypothetical protein